ncbi:ModD protein [Rhodospirillum rubrum]|uniref:ModD protein n=1 Tax=Rhodospirillum rubrum TaxID=1085 RepID=UPI001904C4C9|nr:ModD protein [Rhodospirillum rubrum]MBK1663336.1 ModD protein [Rhodospirillum rubrum]MBK1675147.1 ModD protein [Rhodospirillum rubrum]
MVPRLADSTLLTLLAEDTPFGDLTTDSLDIGARPGRLVMRARAPMVLCGVEEAVRLCQLTGAEARAHHASGDRIAADTVVLSAEGSAASLHLAWKVAQTLMEYASGIASAARLMVDAARAENPAAIVATTRKAFPGTRALAMRAAQAGGAIPHRLGLSETLLVFAEHRAFLDPGERAGHLAALRARCPERRLVVEVCGDEEARAAALAGAEVLQLERFSPADVGALAAWLAATPAAAGVTLAAAGGVTPENAGAYVRAGARVLVTSAPYFAKPKDIKVSIEALPAL